MCIEFDTYSLSSRESSLQGRKGTPTSAKFQDSQGNNEKKKGMEKVDEKKKLKQKQKKKPEVLIHKQEVDDSVVDTKDESVQLSSDNGKIECEVEVHEGSKELAEFSQEVAFEEEIPSLPQLESQEEVEVESCRSRNLIATICKRVRAKLSIHCAYTDQWLRT